MLNVYKFGGASVKDAEGVKNVAEIIQKFSKGQLLIIASAMGKTTNALESIVRKKVAGEDALNEIKDLLNFHENICESLFQNIPKKVALIKTDFLSSLDSQIDNKLAYQDKIVAFGELFSTQILAEYLQVKWVDARNFIKTDDKYSEAEVDWIRTKELINESFPHFLNEGLVVTQGFIASGFDGITTTLGREGSDFTGAIFAHCLSADGLTVWKDVPGLLNADPKIFPNTKKFDHISYQEVIEMTYYGAKVIHPKTIRPLAQLNIPLFVKSFFEPEKEGTEISGESRSVYEASFVLKECQLLVSVRVKDDSFMDERKMGFILQALDNCNIKANLIHNSALTFTFCMDDSIYKRDRIIDALSKQFQVLYNEDLYLATIKNYEESSLQMLPENIETMIEEKSRSNYRIVYRLI